MKKIAMHITFPETTPMYGTGVQVYALRLAEILIKNFEVTLFVIIGNGLSSMDPLYKYYNLSDNFKNNVKVFCHFVGKHDNSITYNFKYKKMLKSINQNYDLFIQTSITSFWGLKNFRKSKCKSVHIIHFPYTKFSQAYNFKAAVSPGWFLTKHNQKYYTSSYDMFWCNSQFTKDCFLYFWGKPQSINVLYPPMNLKPIDHSQVKNKKNLIITIGRLTPDKHILEMAYTFSLFNKSHTEYKFVILGQSHKDYLEYENNVKNALKGSNYEIQNKPDNNMIEKYCTEAKYYWHAKGFNEKQLAQKEHFGMSTVEAMAKGCIPVVYNGGGQREIVTDEYGIKWSTTEELLEKIENIINDDSLQKQMAINSIERSKIYDISFFKKSLNILLDQLFSQ